MKCSIKEFHDFIYQNNIDLSSVEINVNTRRGFKRIWNVAITAYNSASSTIFLENGYNITASLSHNLYKYPGKWMTVRKLTNGDSILTKDGYSQIVSKIKNNFKEDLYDLEVDDIHEYYTNNIVSHNSTISQSIKLGLYGKLKEVTLKEIPNRINKNGEIFLKFQSNGKTIQIVRKFEPSDFKLYVNNKEIDLSSKKETKSYLEDTFLDMPYYVFDNMISLSLHDFKSFISMSPADKRNIIDKVFSLYILNSMKESVKKKRSDVKLTIDKSEATLNYVISNIESTEQKIKQLAEKLKIKKDSKLDEYQKQLEVVNEKMLDANSKIDKVQKIYKERELLLINKRSEITSIEYEIKNIKKSLDLYNDSKCPKCGSNLTIGEHVEHKEEFLNNIKIFEDKKIQLQSEYSELNDSFTKAKDKMIKLRDVRSELNAVKSELNSKILKESKQDNNAETIESFQNIIDENENKRKELELLIKKSLQKFKFYNISEDILSEDGIKKNIIAGIIPGLNESINEFLKKFDMPFSITFDEKFNTKIKSYGEEISSGSLSLGESKILDFCILLSMLKILKYKYSNLNVLFLDEIFASLHPNNIQIVIKILKDFSKEFCLNIFVINHSPLPIEHFDNMIKVEKTNRFSDLKYINTF